MIDGIFDKILLGYSRYRSKYRNRKADSSDESEEDAGKQSPEQEKPTKKESTDSLYQNYDNSLSRFFKGIQGGRFLIIV